MPEPEGKSRGDAVRQVPIMPEYEDQVVRKALEREQGGISSGATVTVRPPGVRGAPSDLISEHSDRVAGAEKLGVIAAFAVLRQAVEQLRMDANDELAAECDAALDVIGYAYVRAKNPPKAAA